MYLHHKSGKSVLRHAPLLRDLDVIEDEGIWSYFINYTMVSVLFKRPFYLFYHRWVVHDLVVLWVKSKGTDFPKCKEDVHGDQSLVLITKRFVKFDLVG